MRQKYEVFHDSTQIILSGNPASIKDQQHDSMAISCTSKEDVEDIKELIVSGLNSYHINLFSPDLKSLWENFKSSFLLIEAAGGIVKNELGQMLMIHRRGTWDLPKGKIDEGESESEAALREVQEECGIENLQIGEKIGTTYHIYLHKSKWVLKPTHWFEMTASSSENLHPEAEEGIDAVVWKSESEVKEVMNSTYPSLKSLLLSLA